jgi:hypothetical protein
MEKITLRIFWISMLACATLAIVGIWTGGENQPDNEPLTKAMGTFFIIGFANFLVWAPLFAYRVWSK